MNVSKIKKKKNNDDQLPTMDEIVEQVIDDLKNHRFLSVDELYK